jgi:hypothetical protein
MPPGLAREAVSMLLFRVLLLRGRVLPGRAAAENHQGGRGGPFMPKEA